MFKNYLSELERLVIPIVCPGCGLRDTTLCAACGHWLGGPLRRVEGQIPRLNDLSGNPLLPVWALGDYAGPARGMVVAWKDRGREDLDRIYRLSLGTALRDFCGENLFPRFDLIVPMPSSEASVRQRGRDHLQPLCRGIGQVLNVKTGRALTKRTTRDQVGLSARARGQARISVRRFSRITAGDRVLLLDDVVTTGATLAAAYTALTTKGCDVVGALVLAATPPRATTAPQFPAPAGLLKHSQNVKLAGHHEIV